MRASPWIAGLALAGAVGAAAIGGPDAAARLETRWQEEAQASLPAGSSLQLDVEGRNLQVSGLVESDEERIAVRDALRDANPQLIVDDRIRIRQAVPETDVALWTEADSTELAACQIEIDRVLANRPIEFVAASAALTESSLATIDALVEVLDQSPDFVVEIAGHADRQGSRDLNRPLSEARAQAVRALLVQRGIDEDRLLAIGYGEDQPIADDRTEIGRRQNRRIELTARGERP